MGSEKNELLWNTDHGHLLESCQDSLKKLQLEYLDLYLVHFPVPTRHTGDGGNPLDEDGVLDIDTTISLETTWHAMEDLVSKGLVRSIAHSGAAANAELFGTVSCLDDPVLQGLAEKYKKTAAQIALRWGIQRNTVFIPKTSRLERLQENF
ncbi:Aldo/keto reductase [Corchorus olitorius]|uniref:Aldo/keto reductase n=1 Tax=Corchorus olitorius TaxID=93759 RepID=A0A1R3K7Q4_9ROSI|nr:Aldo/keto reductase [Corchorus olitorius]